MNRTEMVDIISRQRSLDAPVVEDVLRSFLDLVILNLAVGEPVTIRGFGRFDPKVRPNANLKHPRTGELIATGERTTINFKPSRRAKRELNPPLANAPDLNPSGSTACDETAGSGGDGSLPTPSIAGSGGEWMTITG